MTAYRYGTTPRDHQKAIFETTRDYAAWGYFLEQRLGKTKIGIDNAAYLWGYNKIDALLVIAPSGVHRGWVSGSTESGEHPEGHFGTHVPPHVTYRLAYWASQGKKAEQRAVDRLMEPTDDPCLRVLSVNVEAIGQSKRAYEFVKRFVSVYRCMVVVDESTCIKSANKRTERVLEIAEQCPYRRLMSGEPGPEGPIDYFYQLRALDENPLGFSSYYAFRGRYAILRKQEVPHPNPKKRAEGKKLKFQKVVGYQNQDEFRDKLDRISTSLRRKDCYDLPDASFGNRHIEPTGEQKRLYNEILEDGIYRIDDEGDELDGISLNHVLTRLLRAQQVLGGFVTDEAGNTTAVSGANPKLDALRSEVAQIRGKVVVWSVFAAEQNAIAAALREDYGHDAVVEYHGRVKTDVREENKAAFQNDDNVRVFVGSPKAGKYSLELSAANDVLWFSWADGLEPYIQANDRVVHVDKQDPLYYLHLVVPGSVESKSLGLLGQKKSLATSVRTFREVKELMQESKL